MNWDNDTIQSSLEQMATTTDSLLEHNTHRVHMVGIETGGVWVAEALNRLLPASVPLSTLTTSFHRDDFTQRGLKSGPAHSNLPLDIDGCTIVLVDDVLMSGRSIRAALNELFDYGRPARVLLAVLFDIGHRELPIRADICGEYLTLDPQKRVELHGPAPLTAQIKQLGTTYS